MLVDIKPQLCDSKATSIKYFKERMLFFKLNSEIIYNYQVKSFMN